MCIYIYIYIFYMIRLIIIIIIHYHIWYHTGITTTFYRCQPLTWARTNNNDDNHNIINTRSNSNIHNKHNNANNNHNNNNANHNNNNNNSAYSTMDGADPCRPTLPTAAAGYSLTGGAVGGGCGGCGVVLCNKTAYNRMSTTTPCFHCTPLWWILRRLRCGSQERAGSQEASCNAQEPVSWEVGGTLLK